MMFKKHMPKTNHTCAAALLLLLLLLLLLFLTRETEMPKTKNKKQIICAFGIGKVQQGAPVLEWGTPTVADCLRGSVRRVADRLRDEGQWTTMSELVEHMRTPRGVDECEGVLGVPLAEVGFSLFSCP